MALSLLRGHAWARRSALALLLLLLAAAPSAGFARRGGVCRARGRRAARPTRVAAAEDAATALAAPRSVGKQGYEAPAHLRTWAPFTYATPRERRAAARDFSRRLSERQGRAPDDLLPALPPIRIALLGGPSSGKGTLAPMISACFRTRVLGVGALLRGEIRAESPRAALAAEVMASGSLLPDDLVVTLLEERVLRSDGVFANGWLLDGFPRTLAQARTTLSVEHAELRPDCVLVVERPDELVKEFALGRMADAATGATYHPTYAPAPPDVVSRLVWRVDDTPAVVETRLREHRATIAPIVAAYEAAAIPVLCLDNARSELETFRLAAQFVEGVGAAKLFKMGAREGFRARVFGPAATPGSSGLLDADVAPICLLDETEEQCMARYYGDIRAGNAAAADGSTAGASGRAAGAVAEPARGGAGGTDLLLEAVRRCNEADRSQYVPVLVGEAVVGWASAALVEQLAPHIAAPLGRAVELVERPVGGGGAAGGGRGGHLSGAALRLAPGVVGLAERTAAVAALVEELVADGTIAPGSVRSELQDVWPVSGRSAALAAGAAGGGGGGGSGSGGGAPPVLRMERAAMVHFGVPSYGIHVNGYVAAEPGGPPSAVWIARRSMSKATYPGLLDQMVAGGQPAQLSFEENMQKEVAEEASLPPSVVRGARAAGLVSYCYSTRKGLSTKALAVFDLQLPDDVEPVNADGEVDEFLLLPVGEALDSVRTQLPLWKPNAALVMVDFAVRHGFVTPDEPCYEELVRGLRAGMPSA